MNNKNLVTLITGATLLSIEEACQVPKDIQEMKNEFWWLRSPGDYTPYAAFVDDYGCVDMSGGSVNYTYYCVRPALHLESEISDLKDGDKIKVGSFEFDVVCGGKYALCTTSIGSCAFRKNWEAEDANIYEASDVKKFVDRWYEDEIKGQKVAKAIVTFSELGVA